MSVPYPCSYELHQSRLQRSAASQKGKMHASFCSSIMYSTSYSMSMQKKQTVSMRMSFRTAGPSQPGP